ncbi:MAG TPA: TlpA disulfide reductase family protein [Gammaproteobacteria bacterium]
MSKRWIGRALAAAIAAASAASVGAAGLTGAAAPDFVLRSVTGENLRLSEYRGEVVMLAFWATWCGDCRSQLEELGPLHERYRDAGFELLAISLDQNLRQAEEGAESLGATYPVLHDAGGAVGQLYEVERLPFVVLIDRSGVVRDVFQGHRRGEERQYLERVQGLLRE